MSRKRFYWWICFWINRLFGKRFICGECKAKTFSIIRFKLNNAWDYIQQPENEHYCSKCIEKMAIKCAWCEEPITIGEPITLYSPCDKEFKVPEGAVIYSEKPLKLVGCLRMSCADTGADRSGFWHPPGKVYRVMSAIEEIQSRIDAGEECPIVISSDITNIEKAIPVTEEKN